MSVGPSVTPNPGDGGLTVDMRPNTPLVGDAIAWFAALALAPIYMLIGGLAGRALLGLGIWTGAVLTLLAVLAWTGWHLAQRRASLPRPPALVTDRALVVTPRGWRRPVTLAYADIRYLARVPGESLTLGRDAAPIELHDDDFVAPQALDLIELAIRRAVVALPDGPARYATMQANQRLTRLLGARSVPVTWTLLGISAVMFLLELALGAPENPREFVRLGANVPALVRDGQWWRLVTAGFLHANLTHIALNGMALMSVGALLEKLVGHTRLLIVALSAGIAGNLASTWFGGGAMSVGASSCVFGLLGALLAVQFGKQASLPPQLVVSRRQWVFLLGVNAAISLLPGIDLSAHAGGFAAGAALGALFVPGLDIRRPRESLPLRIVAVLLVLVCTLAFALAAHRGLHDGARRDAERALGARVPPAGAWARRALPGFSLELPLAPVISHEGDYQVGKLVVRNPRPPTGFFVSIEWAAGDATRAALLAGERAFAEALDIRDPPRLATVPGPDGKAVDTLVLEVDRAPLRIARLPCGRRYIQIAAYGDADIDALFARVLASVRCMPIAEQEALARWQLPLHLDLPGWHGGAQAPGRLVLSDGSATLLALRHPARLDARALSALLQGLGADVRFAPAEDGRLRYAGSWEGKTVHGGAVQRVCQGGAIVLLAFAPDEEAAARLLERMNGARCARPDEAPQLWPAAPAP
ncbi:MAG: rhomboid family intramembrane serine protease [Gammaproteobacteria bacterium]